MREILPYGMNFQRFEQICYIWSGFLIWFPIITWISVNFVNLQMLFFQVHNILEYVNGAVEAYLQCGWAYIVSQIRLFYRLESILMENKGHLAHL